MRSARSFTLLIALFAATTTALLTGCSGSSPIAPRPTSQQSHARSVLGRVPAAVGFYGALKINTNTVRHFTGFDSCPASGPLTYISDYNNSVINIYAGALAGQGPCGQIVNGLQNPQGLFVKVPSHKLYVANTGGFDIVVFDRGSLNPAQTYTDPTGQLPVDVTVASDNTVIASNFMSVANFPPSISTWHGNGSFVGNFQMPNAFEGLFVTAQAGAAGRIYYNDLDANTDTGVVYTGKCPAGHCGTFTPTPSTTDTLAPGGLRSRNADTRLIQFDAVAGFGGERLRYNDVNPLFPPSSSCNINGGEPIGFDMNNTATTIYYADENLDVGTQMTFFCGSPSSVPGNPGGLLVGAAHDPPEAL